MIKEAYVSFEVAKLLKEKGFKEWCNCGYGIAVRHNGKDIDEDEEYELESEGRGDEIEYIEGGHLYHMNCNNKDCLEDLFACPTHQMAMAWLRKKGIECVVIPIWNTIGKQYRSYVLSDLGNKYKDNYDSYSDNISYEEAVEAVLKYSLENLIKEAEK